jgi:hypothetical protein
MFVLYSMCIFTYIFKGIFQPFELGSETRLIHSTVILEARQVF